MTPKVTVLIISLISILLTSCAKDDSSSSPGTPPREITSGEQEDIAKTLKKANSIMAASNSTNRKAGQGLALNMLEESLPLANAAPTPDPVLKEKLEQQIRDGDCAVASTGEVPPQFPSDPNNPDPELPDGNYPFHVEIKISGTKCLVDYSGIVSGSIDKKTTQTGNGQPPNVILKMYLNPEETLTLQDESAQRTYDVRKVTSKMVFNFNLTNTSLTTLGASIINSLDIETLTAGPLSASVEMSADLRGKGDELISAQLNQRVNLSFKDLKINAQVLLQAQGQNRSEVFKLNGQQVTREKFEQQLKLIFAELPGGGSNLILN